MKEIFKRIKKYRELTLILAVLAFFFFNFSVAAMRNTTPNWNVERVISNRGSSEEVENSFAAYDLAIRYGSQYIEQDIVASKEGTLYISKKLSAYPLTGVNKLYSEMSDKEIDSLRIKKSITKKDLKILKLQEVFNRYQARVTYVLDLKIDDAIIPKVIDIIKKNGLENYVVIQERSVTALSTLEKALPKMKKMLHVSNETELAAAVKNKDADNILVFKSLMTEKNVKLVHENKKKFSVWTLNETEEIQTAINLKVDSYFTDFTGKAILLEKAAWKK